MGTIIKKVTCISIIKEFSYTPFELRVLNYELRVLNYELRVLSYELRVLSYELVALGAMTLRLCRFARRSYAFGAWLVQEWGVRLLLQIAQFSILNSQFSIRNS